MKVNFKETVKQKTDEELEVISKDYVFYSEEERLIALNELELRSDLSDELLNNKRDIEASIEIPEITEQALEAVRSTKRIYKDNKIWVGTYLGGPLVAGYLIAENFKSFNEINKAKKTWVFTIIGSTLIFIGVSQIPDSANIPNYIIPLFYTAIAYGLAKYYQDKNISAYIALGGKPFGWWRTIIVSLIGFIVTGVSIFGFIFLSYFIANT